MVQHRVVSDADLPTARSYLKHNFRLMIWCRSCRNRREMEFREIVDQGEGDVPIVKLKFRCTNCKSLRTDAVVSGSHLRPSG
jgi:hypothetical protein